MTVAWLYYMLLASIVLFTGLRFCMLLQDHLRFHHRVKGPLLQIACCLAFAPVITGLWRYFFWYAPVLLALALLLPLLLWIFCGFDGVRTIPSVVLFLAVSTLWLWTTEVRLLPRVFSSFRWQGEFLLSLGVHILFSIAGLLLTGRFRVWLRRRVSLPRAWSGHFMVVLFFAVVWYSYISWVLDTSGFYYSLGVFTGFVSGTRGSHYILAWGGSVVLLTLLALSLFAIRQVSRLGRLDAQTAIITARNKALMDSYIGVQRYYHDMKHHLEIIHYLARQEDTAGIEDYLSELESRRQGIFQEVNSGNIYVDAVLNSKIMQAQQKGMVVESDISYPSDSKIAPLDICTVLANLLDNALEHSQRDCAGNLRIRVAMTCRNHFLVLKVSNTVSENPLARNPTLRSSKPEKQMHGVGLQNVRDALRTYHGEMSFHFQDGFFQVHITMNC